MDVIDIIISDSKEKKPNQPSPEPLRIRIPDKIRIPKKSDDKKKEKRVVILDI